MNSKIVPIVGKRDFILASWCIFLFVGLLYQGVTTLLHQKERVILTK